MIAARNAAVPMGKMGTAWDVAAAAVFLASDEAKFITGVCLPGRWRAELRRAASLVPPKVVKG